MDDVKQQIVARRQFLASKTSLAFDLHSNLHSNMTDYNSKVDLRPQWMINDNNAYSGKPHVDAVLQPQQRALGIPRTIPKLSADQLKGVTLRKTGIRNSIDSEGMRTKDNYLSSTVNERLKITQNSMISNDRSGTPITVLGNNHAIPIPPPLPRLEPLRSQTTHANEGRVQQPSQRAPSDYIDYNDTYASELVHKEKEIKELEAKIYMMEHSNRIKQDEVRRSSRMDYLPPQTNGSAVSYLQKLNVQPTPIRPRADSGVDLNRSFDEDELKNENTKKWMAQLINDKFDQLSRVETIQDDKPKHSSDHHRSQSRSSKYDRNNDNRGRSSSRMTRDSVSPTRSFRSGKGSVTSVAKSIKSVLFKRTEEAELHSEVDDDDIADANAGRTDFVDLTSEKFTIHGPFVDKELNVFHAICIEYQLAAKISFAKRTPFARTNPAHERVYALIGSNRRTGWTNRNSWSNVTNDLQVLDYIFKRIIRSNSKIIRKPVMELEHFTERSILDTRRFWKIMKSIFKKREHLAQVLNTNVEKYEDIK